ncbi:MAG TPA: fumarylacetoacetase [Casimicrobiaceae bacterium]|nr:fumarylacetoacetase [Casimicrobiaceae bacterium]
MRPELDETHDPALASWVESANAADADFPIQNLPFGRFRRPQATEWCIAVAIGDQALDLLRAGLVDTDDMNRLMQADVASRHALRRAISRALRRGSAGADRLRAWLVPQADVEMGLPCRIGDYTDFYTGIHHATNVGKLFRPDNPLLPNYKWVPIGYHGRASSIVASPRPFERPSGQFKLPDEPAPSFGPTRRLDFELELGAFVGMPNALGEPIPMEQAEAHLFGLALLNDWTARDVQTWEYQPLGPFLSKSFATSVSPWIVTLEALAPFRVPFERPAGDPQPLPYLDSVANRRTGAIDISLEVALQTAAMRDAGSPAQPLMTSNFRESYWTLAQLVAHHSVNGCNLQAGDLLGTGTQSGSAPAQGGSLLELSQGGKLPLRLANGESRSFLEDGDSVILRARCERSGFRRIGFGECRGTVLPARVRAG